MQYSYSRASSEVSFTYRHLCSIFFYSIRIDCVEHTPPTRAAQRCKLLRCFCHCRNSLNSASC